MRRNLRCGSMLLVLVAAGVVGAVQDQTGDAQLKLVGSHIARRP